MTIQKCLVLVALVGTPLIIRAETWNDVPLVDANCSGKVKANPDAHTRNCALQCSKAGYGILASDGRFLRFDSAGNEQALTALKASQTNDHLRVNVTGDPDGETIKVKTLKMQN
jgi:hypothetical protein